LLVILQNIKISAIVFPESQEVLIAFGFGQPEIVDHCDACKISWFG